MAKKSHYQSWAHLAKTWGKNITPPSIPCKAQIKIWDEILKKIIKEKKKPRALILGATPEIRDLCLKNNFETITCDVNPDMIEGMKYLMKCKDYSQEKTIVIDWLKMKLPKDSLDVIIGDAFLNQLSNAKDVEKLIKNISHLLKPRGLLLMREVVRLSSKPVVGGEKDWVRYFKKYEKGELNRLDLYSFYKYQSEIPPYKKSPTIVDCVFTLDKLKKLNKQENIFKDYILWLEKALGGISKPMLIFIKKDLENLLKKYFKLLKVKQCKDCKFCKYMPMFLAQPKK